MSAGWRPPNPPASPRATGSSPGRLDLSEGNRELATTTKKDLAHKVSEDIGCRKDLASQMVDTVFEAMRDSLIDGRRIEIRGFGVFQVKKTRPKPAARNPRTGQIIHVPARRKTHFRPGKLLKEELHRPLEHQPQETS